MTLRLVAVPAAAVLLVAGCAEENTPMPVPTPTSVAASKTLSDLWETELRGLDTTPCAGETPSDGTALNFDCERALREVARVAPLVLTDAERRGVAPLARVASEAEDAAEQWLDGGTCTQRMEPADTTRLNCLTSLWTAMNGPHKMLETMKQAGN